MIIIHKFIKLTHKQKLIINTQVSTLYFKQNHTKSRSPLILHLKQLTEPFLQKKIS